jgi:hypothetical protein
MLATTTVHAFFDECGKRERLPERRRRLQLLSIGVGGLILKKVATGAAYATPSTHYTLAFDDGEFTIPDEYSDAARDELVARLWPDDGEYARLERAIGETKMSWTSLRKNEKLTLIDQYVVRTSPPAARALARSTLILAALFKLVSAAEVVYDKYELVSVRTDTFRANCRFTATAIPSTVPRRPSGRSWSTWRRQSEDDADEDSATADEDDDRADFAGNARWQGTGERYSRRDIVARAAVTDEYDDQPGGAGEERAEAPDDEEAPDDDAAHEEMMMVDDDDDDDDDDDEIV